MPQINRIVHSRYFIVPLLLLLVSSATAAERLMTVDDVLALTYVDNPQIDPDGAWVAYTVDSINAEDDEYVTTVYMAATASAERVQLTDGKRSASAPRWSPDGRYLAFLAADGDEDEAKTQVFTLDRRGGEAQRYSNVPQGVEDFRWSPDGSRMLLLIKDMNEGERADLAAIEAGDEPKPRPWVVDRLQFKQDGTTYLDRSRVHLYVSDVRDSEPLQLTFGDFDDSEPAWSPDGKQVVFVSNRSDEPDNNDNSDLWVVAATGKDPARTARRVTTNPGSDYAPSWSHDGRQLAYVTVTEPDLIWYATNHLATVPATGGEPRVLTTELDRNVASPRFAGDDRAIYFMLEDSAERHLAALDLGSGNIRRPVDGGLSVSGYDISSSGAIALAISTPQLPTEIFMLEGDELSQLTTTNALVLDTVRLAATRDAHFKSADGTEIEGIIVTPPDYRAGQSYPTLLRLHGGPVSQYELSFNRDAQLFAANGYVVVMANPRGSSGYGQAFSAALFAQWGVKDFEDVMAAVDYAIDQGLADPDRLGVGGWSYGGILTNYVITKTERFEGAITGASEVLFVSNYGHDHYQKEWEKELGLPWENREQWEAITPFNDVGKVTTPTLVMGGKDDWNVPINNSEQLYQALKRRGIDTELVVYPGQSHGFTRPSFIHDRYERYLAWYNDKVRGR